MDTQGPSKQPKSSATRHVRRWLGAGAVALALSALLVGGTAFAHDGTATGSALQQAFIDRLAEKLGITSDDLRTKMDEAGNEVVDEALANGDLTQEQADALRGRIAHGDYFFGFGHPHGGGHPHGDGHVFGHAINLDTIATTLGMTTHDLRAELESGKTLSEIITERGSTVEAVVAALVADAQAQLHEAVANGHLTQAQADEILAELPERLTEIIENGLPSHPGHHHHWSDNDGSTDGPDATETSTGI